MQRPALGDCCLRPPQPHGASRRACTGTELYRVLGGEEESQRLDSCSMSGMEMASVVLRHSTDQLHCDGLEEKAWEFSFDAGEVETSGRA